MIRPIVHSEMLLRAKAQEATVADLDIAHDLLDTLKAHKSECVGMAANMIGAPKRLIAFVDGEAYRIMFNPELTGCKGPYETEEGCLSLEGSRKTRRYHKITARFQDEDFSWHEEDFSDWTAEIIQHEIDHTHGVLI